MSGASSSDAGIREFLSKSKTPTVSKTSTVKKPSAAGTVPVKPVAATVNRLARKSNTLLVAQTDDPLKRLRQRDPEQRFQDAVEDVTFDPFEGNPRPPVSAADVEPLENNTATGQRLRSLEPAPIEPPEARLAALDDPKPDNDLVAEPVTSPEHLKKIGDIQPFYDYHPASALKEEACWQLCPRPDGLPCRPDESGNVPECPNEFHLNDAPYSHRPMAECLYQWQATDLWHNPLYFEDPALERYGHVHHELIQPFVSLARSSVQLVGLPYQMTIDPVCKKMYTLGYYRPGECAPKKYYKIPWNTHAALVEAGVWTGLIYLFP